MGGGVNAVDSMADQMGIIRFAFKHYQAMTTCNKLDAQQQADTDLPEDFVRGKYIISPIAYGVSLNILHQKSSLLDKKENAVTFFPMTRTFNQLKEGAHEMKFFDERIDCRDVLSGVKSH